MNKQWIYALLAFLGGCSFGILSTFVKIAYSHGFTPAQVVGSQFFGGAVILWVIVLLRKKYKMKTSMVFKLLASGIAMAGSGLCYYQSLKYLDASIAIIMLFQFSWMGLFAEWILDRRMPAKRNWLSAVILFSGSLLAAGILNVKELSMPLPGVIWGLLAAVSFTAFIFLSGRVGIEVPPLTKSMLMSTGAFIVVSLIFPPKFLMDGTLISGGLYKYAILLGVFGVILPPLLFSISMPKVGSGLGTILSSSELPTAVLMSVIVLREHVSIIQWLGVLVVLAGIALPNIRLMRKRQTIELS